MPKSNYLKQRRESSAEKLSKLHKANQRKERNIGIKDSCKISQKRKNIQ
jgi:hypothetical protein